MRNLICHVAVLGFVLVALAACDDDPKSRVGDPCANDQDCESGFCYEEVCLNPSGDEDNDGLTNLQERELGFDPYDEDSDDDGITDDIEAANRQPGPDATGSPDGGSTDTAGGGLFEVAPPGTQFIYVLDKCGGDTQEVPVNYDNTEDVNGETFRRIEVGDFTSTADDRLLIYSRFNQNRIEFIGASVYYPGSDGSDMSYLFEAPVGGPLDASAGDTGMTETTGEFCLGVNCSAFDIEFSYEVLDTNATIEVPYGTVDGCYHIRFQERSSDMPEPLETNWWVKQGIGMVKTDMIPGYCGLELVSFTLPE